MDVINALVEIYFIIMPWLRRSDWVTTFQFYAPRVCVFILKAMVTRANQSL